MMFTRWNAGKHQSQRGFTLIEAMFSLTLVGLAVAALIMAYRVYLANTGADTTRTNTQLVVQAVDNFVAENGRFPCPAAINLPVTDVNYGREADCTALTGYDAGGTVSAAVAAGAFGGGIWVENSVADVNNKVVRGMIPFHSLNIPESYVNDGYGSRLFYAVTAKQTNSDDFQRDGGAITVVDGETSGDADSANASTNHFVIFSAGKNRQGAYSRYGKSIVPCGTGEDSENCNTSSTNLTAVYRAGFQNTNFDDFVVNSATLNQPVWRLDEQNQQDMRVIDLGAAVNVGDGDASAANLKMDVKGVAGSTGSIFGGAVCLYDDESKCFDSEIIAGVRPELNCLENAGREDAAYEGLYMRSIANSRGRCGGMSYECPDTVHAGEPRKQYVQSIDDRGQVVCSRIEFPLPPPGPPTAPIIGICGASDGLVLASAPTSDLCLGGTPTAVAGSGPWTWDCLGADGGGDDSCSADALPLVNGNCGTANGTAVSSAPTSDLCTSGTATAVAGSGPWTWDCQGSGGGSDATCSAPVYVPVVNGACGSAHGTDATVAPTADLCNTGTASAVGGTNPWFWTCNGSGGGTNAACSTNCTGGTYTKVVAGYRHACALSGAGGVKCWGENSDGQLGDNTTTDRRTAVDVTGLTSGVIDIAAGYNHTCAILSSGQVRCWGDNSARQIGDGTTTDRRVPTSPSGHSGWTAKSITAGEDHTCVVTNTDTGKCWGENSAGQIGDNSQTDRSTPVNVYGISTPIVSISAGASHSCLLLSSGTAGCTGSNASGQLGVDHPFVFPGTDTYVTVYQMYNGGSYGRAAKVVAGGYHSCALSESGVFRCWGRNTNGQLGLGHTSSVYRPATVNNISSGTVADFSLIGGYTVVGNTCVVLTDGRVRCWGENDEGQLGDNSTTARDEPTTYVSGISNATKIAVGVQFSCAAVTGGVKCWGNNDSGQLGDGTLTMRRTPVDVQGLNMCPVAGACGSADGTVVTSAPSSNLCTEGASSSVSGTGRPWSWTCAGINGAPDASCSAEMPPAVNAACGSAHGTTRTTAPTAGAQRCSAGTNTSVSGTGPWSWTCSGQYGGTNASCSASVPAGYTIGSCSSTAGACTSGTPSGDNYASGCGTTRTWTCNGAAGGASASCSRSNGTCAVDGACGPAHNQTYNDNYGPPSYEMCASGTPAPYSGGATTGENWRWICSGEGGGASVNCMARNYGQCGSRNGQTGWGESANVCMAVTYSPPSDNLCAVGMMTGRYYNFGTYQWTWTCQGGSGSATCGATANPYPGGRWTYASGGGCGGSPLSQNCSGQQWQCVRGTISGQVDMTNKPNADYYGWNCTFGGSTMYYECQDPDN